MKKRICCIALSLALASGSMHCAFATDLDYGSKYTVLMVQQALTDAGYDCGTPDGIAGSGTKGAIQKYRTDKGLADGDAIDQDLLSALSLYKEVEFTPCSESESSRIPSIGDLESQINVALKKMNAPSGTWGEFGNLKVLGSLITVDRKYITSEGNDILVCCTYIPNDNPEWTVNYIKDGVNGRYYYLSEGRDSEDLYDYNTGKLLSGSPAKTPAQPSQSASNDKVHIDFYPSVKNDVTGRWRLAITDTSHPVKDYLISYYQNYFKSDDEIHGIINTTDGTTTRVSVIGSMLNVTVLTYIPGEEGDAKILFGGDVISDGFYNKTTGQVVDF